MLAGRRLPAPHRHVDVLRADLDRVNPAAGRLAGDDLRAGAREGLITDLPRSRVLTHRDGEHLDRLRRRMLGLLADLHRRQVPHRARIVVRHPRRLVALEPAEEAGLVLPEVVRARQDAAVLRPDDLLVDEGAELLPHALDHRLPAAGVPAVPGGVGQDGVLDGGLDEALVQLGALARVVPGDGVAVDQSLFLSGQPCFEGWLVPS